MNIKRITQLIFALILIFNPTFLSANEDINYVVSYKWGLIQKDAGDARITMQPNGDGYTLKLYGKTRPWADRIYQLRDTLISNVNHEFHPLTYTRIAHEKGKYARDDIQFNYKGEEVEAKALRAREKKDGNIEYSEKDLSGHGKVFDMLSVFFYLRNVDYSKLKEGDSLKTQVFSGKEVEDVMIRYKGKEEVKLDDKSRKEAYHIVFNFTSKGKRKSSEDIECWISTDSRHVPYLIVGSLPVGQIRCRLVLDKH